MARKSNEESEQGTRRGERMYCSDAQCPHCNQLRQLYENLGTTNQVLAKFLWQAELQRRDELNKSRRSR